jgi:group I intron endonuclease
MGWIYRIFNSKNRKNYIGATENIKKRYFNHFNELKRKCHYNKGLQKDFNKYGETVFKFEVLKDNVNKKELDEYERFFIKLFDSFEHGYNNTTGGRIGFNFTEEILEQLGKQVKNRELKYGEENPLSKISEEECKEIYNRYYDGYERMEEISKDYNISKELISHIVTNNHYYTKDLKPRQRNMEQKMKARSSKTINKQMALVIYNEYKDKDIKLEELSLKYNFGIYVVSKIINAEHWTTQDLECLGRGKITSNPPMSKQKADKIHKLYNENDLSLEKIEEMFDYGHSTIRKAALGIHFTQNN